MKKAIIAACLIAAPSIASAEWKVQQSRKAFSTFPPLVSTIATVAAKAPSHGITARLQIECFTHPQLTGLSFGVVLSKETTPGALGWRYQFDERPSVQKGPYSRTSLTNISLRDASSEEVKGLSNAKRLRLTLLPMKSVELFYDFDVSGAAEAIKSVGCKEFRAR